MGLATPTSIMVGTGRGAQLGVLIKSGRALQRAGELGTLVFDKTGTLTVGKPVLAEAWLPPGAGIDKDALLRLAASVEALSEHPLARAVVLAVSGQLPKAGEFLSVPGQGVTATVEGHRIAIGNERLMQAANLGLDEARAARERMEENGATVVHVAVDGRLAGLLAVSDQLRPEAKGALQRLRDLGMEIVLLTGDSERAAQAVARQLGIGRVIAGVLPDRKAEVIVDLQRRAASSAWSETGSTTPGPGPGRSGRGHGRRHGRGPGVRGCGAHARGPVRRAYGALLSRPSCATSARTSFGPSPSTPSAFPWRPGSCISSAGRP
jgi:ATPase, P-type (transporting), HAD superfamily, subfamily IC